MHALSISNCCQSSAHTYLFWPKNGHDCKAFFLNKSAAVSGRCIIILKRWKEVKVRKEKKSIRNSNNIIIKHTKGWMYCGNSQSSSVYSFFIYIYYFELPSSTKERDHLWAHCESISKTIAFTFRYGWFDGQF